MKNLILNLIFTVLLSLSGIFTAQAAIISGDTTKAGTNTTVSGGSVSVADPLSNSSATITNLNTTTLKFTGDAVAHTNLHLMQTPVIASVATSSQTTATSFIPTALTASITPQSTSSKILLLMSGELSASGAVLGSNVFWSFFRGASNLCNTSDGCGYSSVLLSGTDDYNVAGVFLDSPNTTNATTYTIYFKSSASTTAAFPRDTVTCSLILIEVQ